MGKKDVIRLFLASLLANGHILVEDFPGLAKTMMAKSFAYALDCDFRRVQFTPDLLPSDILGTYVFNQKTSDFTLRKGPIFTNILLADEINRSPPKTQAALLEAMMERQVSIDGQTFRLGPPFIVVATQNPIELEGVYPLPEAQLDRFLAVLRIGYPSLEEELEILSRRKARKSDDFSVEKTLDVESLLKLQALVEEVEVHRDIENYVAKIARATREHPAVEIGVSPRGTQMLWHLSRAFALVSGRDFVIPDDVKATATIALPHRLVLKPGSWTRGVSSGRIVEEIVNRLPVPKIA